MAPVLGRQLSDKQVTASDGTEIGELYNIVLNPKTGQLSELLVTPAKEIGTAYPTDEHGRVRIPAENVKAVKDYILVE